MRTGVSRAYRVGRLQVSGARLVQAAPYVTLVVVLLVWEVAVPALHIPKFILPQPSGVLAELIDRPGFILENTLYTAAAAIGGFLLAVIVAIPLSIVIAYSRLAESIIYPYMIVTRVIPVVAIAPLLAIWFGFGMLPRVIISFSIAFFPIVVNMVLGLRSPDRDLINLLRSLNATEVQTFRKVRIPFSLPLLFAAFRIAAPATVIGAIVAEFIGSDKGLGYVIQLAKGYLNTDLIFLAIFASALLGIAMFAAVVVVERRVLYWHEAHDY